MAGGQNGRGGGTCRAASHAAAGDPPSGKRRKTLDSRLRIAGMTEGDARMTGGGLEWA